MKRKTKFVESLPLSSIFSLINHFQNWKETLLDDLKLVYPSPMVPLTIRSLVEKQLVQMKSSDPHAVLANLMSSSGKSREEKPHDYQRLRLDLWDMPGSTSSCGITHQV